MKFTPISEYMMKSRDERRAHLYLSEPCIEIGGGSQQFRGLLAHYIGTTISTKREAVLCHACHNGECSNVKHLYWGTPRDNTIDMIENNSRTVWNGLIRNHGEESAKQKMASAGRGNLGKTKQKKGSRAPYKLSNFTCKRMSDSSRGTNNSQFGTCWVTNGIPIKIKKEKLNEYLANGYRRGRK